MLKANVLNYVARQYSATFPNMVENSKKLNPRDFCPTLFSKDDDVQASDEDIDIALLTTVSIHCLRYDHGSVYLQEVPNTLACL